MAGQTRRSSGVKSVSLLKHLFCSLLAFCAVSADAQFSRPLVENFSRKDYGRNQTSDNWSVTQSEQGLIYVGNASGVLEYDGRSWDFIPVKFGAYVLSLASGNDGKIFLGSQNEFGFLKADPLGRMTYHSLSADLPEENQFFSNVYKTYVKGDTAFFQSEEAIFIYDGKEIRALEPEHTFHTSFLVNETYYVRERVNGLLRLEGNRLIPADPGGLFADLGIFGMMPFGKGDSILIATHEKGLLTYDPATQVFSHFKTFNDQWLVESGVYGGVRLRDGKFALNTISNGVIILDRFGHLQSLINEESGLRVNDVKQVFQDRENNLWLPLNNGIARVAYHAPLSFYGEESGLKGNVNDVLKFAGSYYAATSSGVFYLSADEGTPSFKPVANTAGQFWKLGEMDGKLFAGGNDGLFEINLTRALRLHPAAVYAMYVDSSLKTLITGNEAGINVFDRQLNLIHEFTGEGGIIKISRQPGPHPVYWAATRNFGVFRFSMKNDGLVADRNAVPDELEQELLLPFDAGRTVFFGSGSGLLVLDEKGESINWMAVYNGVPVTGAVTLLEDAPHNVWLTIDNLPQYIRKADGELIDAPFKAIESGKVNAIFTENKNVTWLATDDALIRYEAAGENMPELPGMVLRRAVGGRDSVLGYNLITEGLEKKLPYELNDLRFEFILPLYQHHDKIQYAYQLAGHDTAWSPWTSENIAVISNLHEGEYVFKVKARDVTGRESAIKSFAFAVRPPWYRTPLAYFGYALAIAGLLYFALKINSKRLRRENEKLEGIIRERTREVISKNEALEQSNQEIAHQKKEITDSINYAWRIQNALLPEVSLIRKHLPDTLLLYKPKDIVSGDFYYFHETAGHTLIAAADCTGHGVPGGFMSVIGCEKLNEAVIQTTNPGKVLTLVNRGMKASLKQTGEEGSTRDGMDISLCLLHPVAENGERIVEYSAANRPLLICGEGLDDSPLNQLPDVIFHTSSIAEIKATKCAIGGLTADDQSFENHQFRLRKGDSLYMFSDGYPDQFGGPKGKKLTTRKFRELIASVQNLSMQEQEKALDDYIENWMESTEQIDDILVVGVRN